MSRTKSSKHGNGTVTHTTFPVDLTPFEMQKYTAIHTVASASSTSHWTLPIWVMSSDRLRICVVK